MTKTILTVFLLRHGVNENIFIICSASG